jgi:hypothetical protein
MQWLLSGGEIMAGIALFVGSVTCFHSCARHREPLQARGIVSFPLAWLIVCLPLTFAFGLSVALVAVGLYTLNQARPPERVPSGLWPLPWQDLSCVICR